MTKLHIPFTDTDRDIVDDFVEQFSKAGVTFDHTIENNELTINLAESEAAESYRHEDDDIPSIDLKIPINSKEHREALDKAEYLIYDLGVGFDTGTAFGGENTSTRCWHMDWSLEGAHIELT